MGAWHLQNFEPLKFLDHRLWHLWADIPNQTPALKYKNQENLPNK